MTSFLTPSDIKITNISPELRTVLGFLAQNVPSFVNESSKNFSNFSPIFKDFSRSLLKLRSIHGFSGFSLNSYFDS